MKTELEKARIKAARLVEKTARADDKLDAARDRVLQLDAAAFKANAEYFMSRGVVEYLESREKKGGKR